jgi:hypothetical protein
MADNSERFMGVCLRGAGGGTGGGGENVANDAAATKTKKPATTRRKSACRPRIADRAARFFCRKHPIVDTRSRSDPTAGILS